ncbi:DeoR/GlpR family DNA-binding transcription regulator [Palleronia sp. LCG004]|uniref:DeoR/GlpR family DNA-binding transcription regulator n=1 Tax=Palleronia sp. LCG004 TaxID=3079304 RepID=UPI0029423CE4|nr:DeoR/GlpR family DNA-binding transcription regulator [Palleronia sp. LCG004]WOI56149.1 DeoR/GlpR family DNA-binding transcription regulator [Palleronia sp. LCG004]
MIRGVDAVDLNNPDIRQDLLRRRLAEGDAIVVTRIAREFGVSADTVRRDLIALEAEGTARRVRGGAVAPAAPMGERLSNGVDHSALARRAAALCEGCDTLILDGGTTILALARLIPPAPGRLIVTPSPWIASTCAEAGIEVAMPGGRLSPRGGIVTGMDVEAWLGDVSADIAFLGACGIEAEFGMSSDDLAEVGVKRAMAAAARQSVIVADRSKIGRRARHRTLRCEAIARLVTDADRRETEPFAQTGLEILHA